MDKTIGVLGGGQLGRMFVEAANRLNVKVLILDAHGSPAKQINDRDHIDGSFTDPTCIRQLAEKCDILTIEIEHVNTKVLEEVEAQNKAIQIHPNWQTIRVIQDKYLQKSHLSNFQVDTAESLALSPATASELRDAASKLGGFPVMLKARTDAYDGKGNYAVQDDADVEKALQTLKDKPLYVERWARFAKEVAVMVVKTEDEPARGEGWQTSTLAFPVVETVHEDSICKLVYAINGRIPAEVEAAARQLARKAVASFWGKGVFGVEMFVMSDGSLLVNEIAPRPHNSGHYTIEACAMSQYEAHLRAILGLPISEDALLADRQAVMLNILGGTPKDAHLRLAKEALNVPRASVHLYGKGDGRPGRKMGHITVTDSKAGTLLARMNPLIRLADDIKSGTKTSKTPSLVAKAVQSVSPASILPQPSKPQVDARPPVVAITMGSDSDLKTMKAGIDLLRDFDIPVFVTITSAHRTPQRMFTFAESAARKGIKVIIAGAGGAAHLPGMIAAISTLPVIGVPVKGSSLDGVDSLYSIVQMPRGCPVATVAINNSVNAAQLALRILATTDEIVRKKLEGHLEDQTNSVLEKAERLEEIGSEAYLNGSK